MANVVAVAFDEEVKERIVYNKHDCRIIGFVGVEDVNNALMDFERSLNSETGHVVTKHIVFMV